MHVQGGAEWRCEGSLTPITRAPVENTTHVELSPRGDGTRLITVATTNTSSMAVFQNVTARYFEHTAPLRLLTSSSKIRHAFASFRAPPPTPTRMSSHEFNESAALTVAEKAHLMWGGSFYYDLNYYNYGSVNYNESSGQALRSIDLFNLVIAVLEISEFVGQNCDNARMSCPSTWCTACGSMQIAFHWSLHRQIPSIN